MLIYRIFSVFGRGVVGFFSLRPRVLVDVSRIDMSTTVLGHSISTPIMIAPTAMHKLAHPEGLNSQKKLRFSLCI